ncbi:hypothetical protein [Kitasatospora sp. NPDC088783]|uniref:hypothetical protein n=1 Tax=Kitasatospora sp. NPDC088783 TaxID=3364077 RepID=UPI0038282BB7
MKTREEVLAALAALPAHVTDTQIAAATGRTVGSVQRNWAPSKGFPPAVRHGAQWVRDRAAFQEWYAQQPFSRDGRAGARGDLVLRAAAALPVDVTLTRAEIAAVLHVTPAAVGHYARTFGADSYAPFPPFDPPGTKRRRWPEVRAWFMEDTEPPAPLPLADVLGPDPRGAARMLADALGVDESAGARIMSANDSRRLRRAALAAAVGLREHQVRWFATRYADADDPFPPADARHTRDVAAVRAWLARHKTP